MLLLRAAYGHRKPESNGIWFMLHACSHVCGWVEARVKEWEARVSFLHILQYARDFNARFTLFGINIFRKNNIFQVVCHVFCGWALARMSWKWRSKKIKKVFSECQTHAKHSEIYELDHGTNWALGTGKRAQQQLSLSYLITFITPTATGELRIVVRTPRAMSDPLSLSRLLCHFVLGVRLRFNRK